MTDDDLAMIPVIEHHLMEAVRLMKVSGGHIPNPCSCSLALVPTVVARVLSSRSLPERGACLCIMRLKVSEADSGPRCASNSFLISFALDRSGPLFPQSSSCFQ